jgi:signal transduction histidine kinase
VSNLLQQMIVLVLGADPAEVGSASRARAVRLRRIAWQALVVIVLAVVTNVIWLATTRAYYWPGWVVLFFGATLAIHAWVVFVLERPDVVDERRMTRALALQAGIAVALTIFFLCAWVLSEQDYFWPIWPILVMAVAFGIQFLVASRSGVLSRRIAALETTRAGAVDQQANELRRIERDLHDGAQARIVALGMSLGMAEQKLASDPEAARELLADARRGVGEALGELRDLARGIHPPVLADRGLEAAISALADRTPLRVRVSVDVDRRPPPAVESAAYFVVAEALANTGKHARADRVDIAVRRRLDSLVVEVVDDGAGGADRSGSGLDGLASRVEALDGTLEVSSPLGGPTTVRAVMPCGS